MPHLHANDAAFFFLSDTCRAPSLQATHACFLSDTRRAPSTPATHAWHTPSSTAPATHAVFFVSGDTRRRAHHARQDRHTIHCRSVTIGDHARADTRPSELAAPSSLDAITPPATTSAPPSKPALMPIVGAAQEHAFQPPPLHLSRSSSRTRRRPEVEDE